LVLPLVQCGKLVVLLSVGKFVRMAWMPGREETGQGKALRIKGESVSLE
jgi:hypothetical protein